MKKHVPRFLILEPLWLLQQCSMSHGKNFLIHTSLTHFLLTLTLLNDYFVHLLYWKNKKTTTGTELSKFKMTA